MHEADIARSEREGTDFYSEQGSRGGQPVPPPEDKLTAEEEEVCMTMHWDPAGYRRQKKQASLMQSDKGAYARYPVPERKTT